MVNTVSDNKLRAAQQVREVLERGGDSGQSWLSGLLIYPDG